jgi:hypothetical protein
MVFFVLLVGCRTQQIIVSGTFTSPQKTYKVILPKEGWTHLRQGLGEDISMQNIGAGGATFAVISHRKKYGNLSLDILQSHLFIGFKHRKILGKQYVTLSGQRASHTILIGEVNGSSEIKISSYVVARNGWVYDLVYWAQPDHFDNVLDDFEGMVRSFVFIGDR